MIDYGQLFTKSWYLVWRHKFLWLFGLLAGFSQFITSIIRLLVGPNFSRPLGDLDQWLAQPEIFFTQADLLMERIASWLIGGAIILFAGSLAVWLMITLAQGAIIGTVVDLDKGKPVGFVPALNQGALLLGRFIAIDTIVYFPLFLVILLLMILGLASLTGSVALSLQPFADTSTLAVPLLIGVVCVLPLLCLLVPLALFTAVFRLLAFRDTVVCQTSVRQVTRHTWGVLKRNAANILILAALLWGVQYVVNWVLRLITLPIYALIAAPGILSLVGEPGAITLTGLSLWVVNLVLELMVILPQAALHAFIATAWTLAYMQIAGSRSQPSAFKLEIKE